MFDINQEKINMNKKSLDNKKCNLDEKEVQYLEILINNHENIYFLKFFNFYNGCYANSLVQALLSFERLFTVILSQVSLLFKLS